MTSTSTELGPNLFSFNQAVTRRLLNENSTVCRNAICQSPDTDVKFIQGSSDAPSQEVITCTVCGLKVTLNLIQSEVEEAQFPGVFNADFSGLKHVMAGLPYSVVEAANALKTAMASKSLCHRTSSAIAALLLAIDQAKPTD